MSTGSLASRAGSLSLAAKALASRNEAFYEAAMPLLQKRLAEMYQVTEAEQGGYFKFGRELKHADSREPIISLTVSVEVSDKAARLEKARIRADEEIVKLLEYELEEGWEEKAVREAEEEMKRAEEVKMLLVKQDDEVKEEDEAKTLVEEDDVKTLVEEDEKKDEANADIVMEQDADKKNEEISQAVDKRAETEVASDKEVEDVDQATIKTEDETKDETKADESLASDDRNVEEPDESKKALKEEKKKEDVVEFHLDITWDFCNFGPL
ncbi:hypothetical protein QBC34DRAFT_423332 [Podospora aff. communis PSN243]|uniref:Uncharacterized protein n=1 Tax=Podospora aff. communis PSN243 TaxID=3040156 RepID=A0AAV9GYF8_9PEZI|nr:hypothetical protein QBC34DRAFT_423332 [Podospora aff. communis PSN243]